MASKPRIRFSSDQLTHNPFGALLPDEQIADEQMPDEETSLEPTTPVHAKKSGEVLGAQGADVSITLPESSARTKIILRMEKKGRGGKKATIIELGHLDREEREQICMKMRSRFGCGGGVEDQNIALSGDQIDRSEAFLRELGAKKIIRGN